MIFHLNHLFNPAKRSMHMYVTEYRKIKTCHWKTQCRHKYLTGYNQLNPERQNFFSPAKLGPWPRQVCTLSLRGNMDCMRLLLDLVLRSQSVLLYVHVYRLYNAYRIAALSIYCQKLTNTELIFFIRNWRDYLRCLIWVKFSIFTCVRAACL